MDGYVPVVIMADLMAEGDQSGWNDLTYAAAPATWGAAMDVPDMKLYLTLLLSEGEDEGETVGENAAKIFSPGALISGCGTLLSKTTSKCNESRELTSTCAVLKVKEKKILII